MNPIGPTTGITPSYHIAKAYGAARVGPSSPVSPIARIAGSGSVRVGAHSVERSPQIARLIAARVPGGIDFNASETASPLAPSSHALYRSPADRNQAATGVFAGRVLDINA